MDSPILVLMSVECLVLRCEWSEYALLAMLVSVPVSRATRTGRHCIGCASPCLTVKAMMSRAGRMTVGGLVGLEAAVRMCGR